MKEVNYVRLSEQYASFLVAIGGVSITALALVLSLGFSQTEGELTLFLVSALVVATVCCFIGAHMMTETAAFISYVTAQKLEEKPPEGESPGVIPLGERMFLLASINIFIAAVLVLFALMLLPAASRLPNAARLKPISIAVFLAVVVGTLYWMILAASRRLSDNTFSKPACLAGAKIGAVWLLVLLFVLFLFENLFLWFTFISIILMTVASLFYFVGIFKEGKEAHNRKVSYNDIRFYSSAIIISYTSLVIAGIKTMFLD